MLEWNPFKSKTNKAHFQPRDASEDLMHRNALLCMPQRKYQNLSTAPNPVTSSHSSNWLTRTVAGSIKRDFQS
jgi:hypothetical protein